MAETTIRAYEHRDLDAVIALVRELQVWESQYFDRMAPPEDIGPSYVDGVLAECAKSDGAVLIAEAGEEVVGYVSIFTSLNSADERDEVLYRYSHVGDLVVAERARGQGIGRALLDACEAKARVAGVRWLRIGVLAANSKARHVYDDFGFRDHHVSMEKALD